MIVKRDTYLQQLVAGRHNGLIKIVTGLRRCGKSFLLMRLFHEYLRAEGIDEAHIIEVALDDMRHAALREPLRMLDYIDTKMQDEGIYYVVIDEVQMLGQFVDVLNSLLHLPNADVYVTGSNSRFLSCDVATEFRGRGDEIHLRPLSFSEFYTAVGGDKGSAWKRYYTYGGLPQLLSLDSDKRREQYLANLHKAVYLRDIVERNNIRNTDDFDDLLCVLASAIGSPCNPNKIANTFKSAKGVALDQKTIASYLSYMEDAFLTEKAARYDVKGRRYIGTLSKYYFQDVGLRNALLNFRQVEENHVMENVIYNELRARGFLVDVGNVETKSCGVRKQLEVDFVANRGNRRLYVQSAFSIPDDEKMRQETASLRRIADTFQRVIVLRDDIHPYFDDNGFLIIGLFDFLLGTSDVLSL